MGFGRLAFLSRVQVGAIFVVIGNVFTEQPFHVSFIERDDVIQQLPAAAADPALGDAILPGTGEGCPHRTHC
jgi:hypothetical protein